MRVVYISTLVMGHIVADSLHANVRSLRERIAAACSRAGRDDAGAVRIVAATKYVDAPTIAALVAAGVADVGENRLDALEAKQDALAGEPALRDVRWHYIGRLQSRKVDAIVPRVSMIETLGSVSAAGRLARLAADGVTLPDVLVQVNAAGDPSKDGIAPADLEQFLLGLDPAIPVRGLMTMPAFTADPDASRDAFRALRELRDEVERCLGSDVRLPELSMGTSQDFEVAVEEGATLVRLGRVLYAASE